MKEKEVGEEKCNQSRGAGAEEEYIAIISIQ